MDVALKRWFDVISQFPEIHETVKQLHLLAGLAEQLRMLGDILSGKTPATLIKRANSVRKYIEKLRETKVQVPGDEPFLYAYFCGLRNSGVALNSLRSFVEAIRFTEFVFGMEGPIQKLLSKRDIGAPRRVGQTVMKRSDPFTVGELGNPAWRAARIQSPLLGQACQWCSFGGSLYQVEVDGHAANGRGGDGPRPQKSIFCRAQDQRF